MYNNPYIQNRGRTFHYVRRVPPSLSKNPNLRTFYGKQLFSRSLKTSCLSQAKIAAHQISTHFELALQAAEKPWLVPFTEPHVDRRDAFDYAILAVEDAFNVSFDREDGDVLTPPEAALKAVEEARAHAFPSEVPYRLSEAAQFRIKDLQDQGLNRPKGAISKVQPAVRWFLGALLLDDISLKEITPKKVRDALRSGRQFSAPETLRGHLSALTGIWDSARIELEIQGENPFKGHKIRGKSSSYSALTWAEVTAIHMLAPLEIKLAIEIGATTGIRIGELEGLKCIFETDSKRLCWSVKEAGDGKTEGSTRIIPVHRNLCHKVSESFEWTMNTRTLTRWMKETVHRAREAKLIGGALDRKVSFHSFRATVASHLNATGHFTDRTIGLLTGHSNQRYKANGSIGTYIQFPDKDLVFQMVDLLPFPFEN
jgi:hypothetical protein